MASLRPFNRVAEQLRLRTRITYPSTTPTTSGFLSRRCSARFYSSEEAPPPPLLQKIKGDLKAAMRAKDAPRLTAIRSVLSAVLNASKTASPITTDAQLVALLRKSQRASDDAAAEFQAAGRQDLVDKEHTQVAILGEYVAASGFQETSEDELRTIVAGVLTAMTSEAAASVPPTGDTPPFGDVMKTLLAPAGPLDGKDVDKAQLAKIVKELRGAN
ncbi:Altered inheritance of mitochondria protein 41, mitochondrial [Daldinia childiae]|uniref:Altered inheritance of mitochondria protein 41, mitochondrial n=1 Tax=Daldinia childiae TaxID=326645 RepID=UPI001445664A|nr:Altered inheritance of mitochondria protein 41, mitochondrial [Daldinia childiae]KAF3061417.1 Altered inheritance of mitochondria protein 41, mitochondrial [Daldinia childiae]